MPEIHDLTGKRWRDEWGKAQRQCERHDMISPVPVIFGNLYGLPKETVVGTSNTVGHASQPRKNAAMLEGGADTFTVRSHSE